MVPLLWFYRFGFIDEHDWNIIPDFVKEFALITDKPVLGLIQVNPPFTLRTG